MTQDARFGELRSILQQPASIETWDALCDHLDLWSPETLEQVALPYTLDIVTRWPDELERSGPKRWVERLLAGDAAALMALVNTLKLWSFETPQPKLAAELRAAGDPHSAFLWAAFIPIASEPAFGAP